MVSKGGPSQRSRCVASGGGKDRPHNLRGPRKNRGHFRTGIATHSPRPLSQRYRRLSCGCPNSPRNCPHRLGQTRDCVRGDWTTSACNLCPRASSRRLTGVERCRVPTPAPNFAPWNSINCEEQRMRGESRLTGVTARLDRDLSHFFPGCRSFVVIGGSSSRQFSRSCLRYR